mgnify:CR=1 FL=1
MTPTNVAAEQYENAQEAEIAEAEGSVSEVDPTLTEAVIEQAEAEGNTI